MLPETPTGDDLVVAFLRFAAWPDAAGQRPDETRCRLCEGIHRYVSAGPIQPCPCPCHPAREYVAWIGRMADVQEHWGKTRAQ